MDAVLESIGPFGLYQKIMLIISGIVTMITAMTMYSTIFTLAEPALICKLIWNNSVILDKNKCPIWQNITNSATKSKLFECQYDKTYYNETLVTDWNLICDKKFYVGLLQTCYLTGTFSSLVTGYFSDRFGRKKTIIISLTLLSSILIISQLVNLNIFKLEIMTRYYINAFVQFIIGATSNTIYSVGFILLLELTTSKYGNLMATLNLYFYVFGEFVILTVSYFFKNWNNINMFLTFFSIFSLIISIILFPESPKYLANQNKIDDAYEIVKKIKARNQGKSAKILGKEEFINNLKSLTESNLNESKDNKSKNGIFEFAFKSTQNIIRILFLCMIWFALCMSFYGVSLGITSIGDLNPYLVYLLSSITELIGYAFCHLNDKFNRKLMLIIFFGSTGLLCLSVTLIPTSQTILIIVSASIGKAMAAAAFNSCFVYTSQLFPTYVRNTFLMLVSSIGRIGSMISPQINLLQHLVWKPLPYIIFSSSSFIACLLVFILPDPSKLNYS